MKQHEKRAIERAIDSAIEIVEKNHQPIFENGYVGKCSCGADYNSHDLRKLIAQEAVHIAQLRAKRSYDYFTQQEAFEYALNLVSSLPL